MLLDWCEEIATGRLRETDFDTPRETDVTHMYCTVRSIRRRFSRGLPKKYSVLLKKLRKAKKECPMHEKPEVVKTHLRNMIIMPEMIGSVVGVYSGKSYVGVEIKAEMVGTYLAECSMTYGPSRRRAVLVPLPPPSSCLSNGGSFTGSTRSKSR